MEDIRSLKVVAFSDIQQFTIKMGQNENSMMKMLREHNEIFNFGVEKYQGRIVKSTGDGFVLEFNTSSEAVKSCIEIQARLHHLNAGKSEIESFKVRIGIHQGEIIHRGKDIFGANVNIAARIEGKAQAGGITISPDVYNSLRSALPVSVQSVGEVELKHVSKPIELYQLTIDSEMIKNVLGEIDYDESDKVQLEPNSQEFKTSTKINLEKIKNRIAVLPVKFYSPKSDDAHLSEGFTDSLIHGLKREKKLYVHSLESITGLGELANDSRHVASILGAAYIVKGTIFRSGTVLRIQIEILQISSDNLLYTEEFECSEDEIFEINIKVVQSILFSVMLRVSGEMEAFLSISKPKSTVASSFFLKGRSQVRKAVTLQEFKMGITLLERATKADKGFILGRYTLASAYLDIFDKWNMDNIWLEKAQIEADAIFELDPESSEANCLMGDVIYHQNQLDEAEIFFLQAIDSRQESITPRSKLFELYMRQGKFEEAQMMIEEGIGITKFSEDKFSRIKLLTNFAVLKAKQGLFLVALEKFDEALNLAKDNCYINLEAVIRNSMGTLFRRIGKVKLGINNYEKSLKILQKVRNAKFRSEVLNNLGSGYEDVGELNKALELFRESSDIAETIGVDYMLATTKGNMGRVYNNLGDNNKAIECLTQSVETWREGFYAVKEATALNNLAAVFCDIGDHDRALNAYEKTRELVLDTGNYPMLANVLLNIGEIHEFRGEYDSALETYAEAERTFQRFDSGQFNFYLYLFRGRLLMHMEQYERAILDLEQVASNKAGKPVVTLRGDIYLYCCRKYMNQDIQDMAIASNAIEELKKIGSIPELIESLRIFGEFLAKNNQNTNRGSEYLELGFSLAQKHGMVWEKKRIKELQLMYIE
ncbi:MAG: tetratricopeptide repeat protein [Calditrichaeota bacterium]|nr:tetratricopeptide repeat protein [Calditrichota bacterium]